MLRHDVRVNVLSGIHFRPAEELTKLAMQFKSEIFLIKGESRVTMKSFLSVLGAGIKYGDEMSIECSGEDEKEALEAIINFLEEL